MTETYATRRRPLALVLDVEVLEPCEMHLTGYDADKAESGYFRRRIGHKEPYSGRNNLVFPMPVTPERLRVRVKVSKGIVVVHGYKFVPLEKDDAALTAEDKDFVAFALWLAINLPQLPPTTADRFPYQSSGGRYMVVLRDRILNSNDTENSTPARISRQTGIAEVSKRKLLPCTVPMRLMILLHEYNHYKLNSTDEGECDLRAVAIFCALGYSAMEGLYTFTNMLEDSPDKPQLRLRVSNVLDALEAYKARVPRYTSYVN